jgi:hypothetical protein
MGDLVHYEAFRRELATCHRIDEAAALGDDAAKLAAYARIRDDIEVEIWATEIKLRATQRIGELSRDLDKAKPGPTPRDASQRGEASPKAQALREVGLSTSAAHRAEELAGGVNGHAAAIAATDRYFVEQRKRQQPPTMKGLRSAVREAVGKADPKHKGTKAAPPSPLYLAWLDFVSAVKTIAEHRGAGLDAMAKQSRDGGALKDTLREAREAAKRLPRWVAALEREKAE